MFHPYALTSETSTISASTFTSTSGPSDVHSTILAASLGTLLPLLLLFTLACLFRYHRRHRQHPITPPSFLPEDHNEQKKYPTRGRDVDSLRNAVIGSSNQRDAFQSFVVSVEGGDDVIAWRRAKIWQEWRRRESQAGRQEVFRTTESGCRGLSGTESCFSTLDGTRDSIETLHTSCTRAYPIFSLPPLPGRYNPSWLATSSFSTAPSSAAITAASSAVDLCLAPFSLPTSPLSLLPPIQRPLSLLVLNEIRSPLGALASALGSSRTPSIRSRDSPSRTSSASSHHSKSSALLSSASIDARNGVEGRRHSRASSSAGTNQEGSLALSKGQERRMEAISVGEVARGRKREVSESCLSDEDAGEQKGAIGWNGRY